MVAIGQLVSSPFHAISLDAANDVWTKKPIMRSGIVKFYNSQTGFGLIEPDDGSKEVLLFATALEAAGISSLTEGQKVTFKIVTERRMAKARSLQVS